MDYAKESLKLHYKWQGKIEIKARAKADNKDALSLAYTPGVAQPCLEIQKDISKSYELTRRWNTVAVVTDGTAVLGLGDIGPEAGMPVMEGKCVLFKEFGGVDAIPLCVRSKDVDVVGAAIINALRIVKKDLKDCTAVFSGAGAAGIAIAKLLLSQGIGNVLMCNSKGIICEGDARLNPAQAEIARITNKQKQTGTLADAMKGADIFIGVSAPGIVTEDMVRSMNQDPIVLPMANPVPEIMPNLAKKAGAAVVGTGRSDFPNQINNVLAFPGIFRGALDCRASDINEEMKIAAAKAIASLVSDEELSADYILPKAFDERVGKTVAAAVAEAARKSGVARI